MLAPLLLAASAYSVARAGLWRKMDCAELRAADKAPGWCTHCNCMADAAQPVLEGQLYRVFPLPNRSFGGGRMAWAEHNVAPFAGDAAFGCIDNAYADWLAGRNTLISVGDFRWSTAYGQYAWCEDAEPGSCHYSGGGARVGNVNPFGPWTHKGAMPTPKRSTGFPSHAQLQSDDGTVDMPELSDTGSATERPQPLVQSDRGTKAGAHAAVQYQHHNWRLVFVGGCRQVRAWPAR